MSVERRLVGATDRLVVADGRSNFPGGFYFISDLRFLRPERGITFLWKQIISLIVSILFISATAFAQSNTQLNRDPTTVKFVTSDIGNFWRPYDLAAKETEKSKRIQIYQTEYFDKASPGLKDFLTLRIKSAQNLVAVIDQMPKYYVHVQGHLNQIGISTLCI